MPLLPLIPAALQGVLGLGQTIFSGKRKAERNLEQHSDSYRPNSSIMDFYQKAYNNYSANPYDSKAYTNRSNMIQRNLATGLNASQDRRSGVGSIGSLVQQANDANAQAAGQAEGQQRANLGMLGQASGMKAQEDFKPFEMKYNLLAAKAGGANANRSAGIQNIFGALGSASNYLTAKEMYGNRDTSKAPSIFGGRMKTDPTTGLPADDDASKQASGEYELDRLTGQWRKKQQPSLFWKG